MTKSQNLHRITTENLHKKKENCNCVFTLVCNYSNVTNKLLFHKML